MFEVSPVLLALVASIGGTTLLVWHQHGGPRWMFALGGFLFILGRLMIAALCAFVVLSFLTMTDEMDRNGLFFVVLPVAIVLGIGAWSALVVARAVHRDAFGQLQEEAARTRHGDRHP
jgi:hypothetical protein